ncbi:hypothetical protein [Aequorivita sinensis]|jgi:hypothetical protein|uniref:hypothetical protein n=1 Tax=Aequorivita sinensis TaxID=1382458 RepID=UPI001120E164|nr:hypothetical protein [Aequorivita sinensis]
MKQRTKDILAIILMIIVIAELVIYTSELNFAYSNIYKISFLNIVLIIGFIFWHSKKLGHRILLTIITIGIGLLVCFFEFVRDFSQTERVHRYWKIDNYEIIIANQEYFAGPGSSAYLKLREKYVFGLFYKDLEEIDNDSTFFELGKEDCIVEFLKTKTEFDLCKKRKLK